MDNSLNATARLRWSFMFLSWICFFLLVVALKETSSIILPTTIAVFLAFILNPVIKILHERFKIPRGIGIVLIILLLAGILWLLGLTMFSSIKSLVLVYPRYETRFLTIYKELSSIFKFSFNEDISLIQNLWQQLGIRNAIQNIALATSSGFVDFFKTLFMVLLITVFMMLEIAQFKFKLMTVFKSEKTDHIRTMIQDIIHQVSKYLTVKFIISLITGVIIFIGFSIVGVEFAILWGIASFAFNFIPTFGSIAISVAGGIFSLMQFWPTPEPVIAVILIDIATNMILGNIIEPKVMGDNLNLSPFLIVVSLSFWSWLWGFTGMVIAVPMMVIVRIICENISFLRPISILMGSAQSASMKLQKKQQIDSNDQNERN